MIRSLLLSLLVFSFSPSAHAMFCDPSRQNCWGSGSGRSSTSPALPSNGSRINLNPSAVPVDKGLGIETIYYKNSFDVALTQGLGRVGAAISPSNAEESFFGPPGFEPQLDYLQRQRNRDKYQSQKISLATAVSLLRNKRAGLKKFELNLGVMGKYNKHTQTVWPGAGISGIIGPLTYGYSLTGDEYQQETTINGIDQKSKLRYRTETISIGIYLSSFVFDYSALRVYPEDGKPIPVSLFTTTLFLNRWILTGALRSEESDRLEYDPELDMLVENQQKTELFGGAQFN
ncbi:MAG TPA: hypothetical protein VM432_06840, partial [Bdellovibrionales bacterium]|nr:hypothetical protein [Bdellovibrionales bacterium]